MKCRLPAPLAPALLALLGLLAPALAGCGGGPGPAAQPRPTVSPSADPPGTRVFTIDTSRSTVSYTVTEHVPTISQFHPAIGTFRVTGRAPVRGGTIHVAPSPGASSVRDVTVDALQLKTDQGLRDQFIDPGLADALAPFAEFSSTSLSGLPATIADGATIQFKLTGRMQIHDVVQPVTLDTTATISGGTLSASATATFDMNVFRVSPPSGGVSTVDPTVTLEVHLVATAGP